MCWSESLRSAVDCILEQEELDRTWLDYPPDLVPVWRPSRTLQNHDELLRRMVRSRLKPLDQDQDPDPDQDQSKLTSTVKQEVSLV